MKLLAYEVDKRPFLGVFNENETWAYPISAAGMEYRSMKDLIREAGPSEMEMLDYISKKAPGDVTGAAPVEEIKIVSPIPEPDQDIICLGINYMDHAAESARFQKEEFARPEKAIYFSKRVNRTNDPDGIIPAHKNLSWDCFPCTIEFVSLQILKIRGLNVISPALFYLIFLLFVFFHCPPDKYLQSMHPNDIPFPAHEHEALKVYHLHRLL